MARRPPAAVRAAVPRRDERAEKVPQIDRLSTGVMREIGRFESSPGAVARALAQWRRTVHGPADQLLQDTAHAGCPCCDPLTHRDLLARALLALGPRGRREFQAILGPLDDVFERRTSHDPGTPRDWPWWRRRT